MRIHMISVGLRTTCQKSDQISHLFLMKFVTSKRMKKKLKKSNALCLETLRNYDFSSGAGPQSPRASPLILALSKAPGEKSDSAGKSPVPNYSTKIDKR